MYIECNVRFFRHEVHLTRKRNNAISGLIWGDFDLLINGENGPFTLGHIEPHVLSGNVGMKFNGKCEVLVASRVNRNISVIISQFEFTFFTLVRNVFKISMNSMGIHIFSCNFYHLRDSFIHSYLGRTVFI